MVHALMLEVLWFYRAYVQWAIFAVMVVIAFRRGDAPERILSSILLGMIVFAFIYHLACGPVGVLVHGVNIGHFANDLWVLAAIIAVALRANRVYPLWMGGAQIIAVLAHLYRLTVVDIDVLAYAIMQRLPGYIQMVAMACGLIAHMRRARMPGIYPAWSPAQVTVASAPPARLRSTRV